MASRTEALTPPSAPRSSLGEVLDADPGQGRDLASPQPRDTSLPDVGQADVVGGQLGAASSGGTREPPHGCPCPRRYPRLGRAEGCPAGTPHKRDFFARAGAGFMETCHSCTPHPHQSRAPQRRPDAPGPRRPPPAVGVGAGHGRAHHRHRPAGHRHVRPRVPARGPRPRRLRDPGAAHADDVLRRHGVRPAGRRPVLGPGGTPAAPAGRAGVLVAASVACAFSPS